MSPKTKKTRRLNVAVGLGALILSAAAVVVFAFLPSSFTQLIEDAIRVAGAAIGLVVAMAGAIKTIIEVSKDSVTIAAVQAGGITVGAGALLVLVSAIP